MTISHIQGSDPKIDYMPTSHIGHCPECVLYLNVTYSHSLYGVHTHTHDIGHFNQVLSRLFMKRHNHPCFHPVSHDNTHYRLSFCFKPPYPGTFLFEVFGRRLRIRIDSQGGTRVLSVVFRCCLFFRLCY